MLELYSGLTLCGRLQRGIIIFCVNVLMQFNIYVFYPFSKLLLRLHGIVTGISVGSFMAVFFITG